MNAKTCENRLRNMLPYLLAAATLALGMSLSASASTLCVSQNAKKGCFSKIGDAVAAASPGDTINVAPGTYNEDVVIGMSLSLIGADRSNTIIDATGLSNGVYVDGLDNVDLREVVVAGFTVQNANFEGILVTNASLVTISNNVVVNNDKNLDVAATICVGQPAYETDEGFDCGEGIHFSGVDHSTVADNDVEDNAGGILLSDDTGATHNNLVTGNLSRNNPFDCGIVLASHAPGPGSSAPHNGVFRNTVSDNQSIHNGYQVPGAGAGVGLFADGTGVGLVSRNVVMDNVLRDNGIGGVVLHSHVGPNFFLPSDDLSNNVIAGNQISGNGADLFDTATPGPDGINVNSGGGGSPIIGTIIAGNSIDNEAVDIAVNTPSQVDAHLNNLLGKGFGVDNIAVAGGAVNATENWWGCAAGPGSGGCSSAGGTRVVSSPSLSNPASANTGKP